MGKDIIEDLKVLHEKNQSKLTDEMAETTDKDEEKDLKRKLKTLLNNHVKQINTVKKCCR